VKALPPDSFQLHIEEHDGSVMIYGAGVCAPPEHTVRPVFEVDSFDIRCVCGEVRVFAKRAPSGGWDVEVTG
jgi:hypothetical protein